MRERWEVKKLDDVSNIFAGGDVPKGNYSKVYTTKFSIPIYTNGEKNKGLYGYTNLPRVTKPCLTISARGTIGYSEIREEQFYPAIRLIVVIPNDDILELRFLKYALSLIDINHSGTSIPQLTVPMVKDFLIPIPSYEDQKNIVSILDKAFTAIDKAKANTEKNLQNAKKLFESYLQEVFEKKGEGWVETQLSNLCHSDRIITYGVIKLGDEIEDGVPCLRTSNVRWLRIDLTGIKRILPKLSEEYSRTILKGDEILVNVRGTLGGVAIVPKTMKGWNVSREVAVIPIDNNKVDPSFIAYFIGSVTAQKWLGGVKKGAAYVGINIEDLRLLPILLPKMKEQQSIIKKLNVLSLQTKKLEAIYQKKIDDLEDLKKSILQKAFAGELTYSSEEIAV
jgi:type I restriction enzyme S subunit